MKEVFRDAGTSPDERFVPWESQNAIERFAAELDNARCEGCGSTIEPGSRFFQPAASGSRGCEGSYRWVLPGCRVAVTFRLDAHHRSGQPGTAARCDAGRRGRSCVGTEGSRSRCAAGEARRGMGRFELRTPVRWRFPQRQALAGQRQASGSGHAEIPRHGGHLHHAGGRALGAVREC